MLLMAVLHRELASIPTAGGGQDALAVIAPPAWTVDALCAETDPEAFFPEKGGSVTEAKRICGLCTVREECLEYALAYESGAMGTATAYAANGIFGGLSPRQRRRVLQDRATTTQQESA